MTSSPAPMPSAISASSSASVPDDTAIAWLTPSRRASSASTRFDLRSHDEALAVTHARDGGENLFAQRLVLRLRSSSGTFGDMRDYCKSWSGQWPAGARGSRWNGNLQSRSPDILTPADWI